MSANLPLIKECFKNINLTPKHAKVYLSLLKNGLSNISRIAKETEIPRSSCYLLIEDLKKQQLVLQQKTKYIAANPEKIAYHLETRQVELTYLLDEFTQNLPKLKTLSMGKRPKIKVLPID